MMLSDRSVLITGGANGLGRGIAEVCVREGAHCLLLDRDEAGVMQTAKDLGPRVCGLAGDVTCAEDLDNAVHVCVGRFGRIDGLVNNAGINFNTPLLSSKDEDWSDVIGTNLTPVFRLVRKVVIQMLAQSPVGGSIVNIGSVHSVATAPGVGPYAAAKAGMVGLTRAVALEFATRNIRANVVSPGLCDTGMWQRVIDAAQDRAACEAYWASNIPIGRPLAPTEIGEIVAFLLSPRSSAITGTNIVADGGMLANLMSKATHE